MEYQQCAGGVVLNKNREILVVNQHGLAWSLPKGVIEAGEDSLSAAKREIHEESGISRLQFVKELGTYQRFKIGLDGGDDQSVLKTLKMFLFTTDQIELKPNDPNNPLAKWVDLEEVTKLLTHKKDKDFFLTIKDKLKV